MDTFYSIRRIDQHWFVITKWDNLFNIVAIYNFIATDRRKDCACPRGIHKQWCEHQNIFALFKRDDRFNSGWFWNPEHEYWEPPVLDGFA